MQAQRPFALALLSVLAFGFPVVGCEEDSKPPAPTTTETPAEPFGSPCQADANCPSGSVCVNPRVLAGSVMNCAAPLDGGDACVATTVTGPGLGWSAGYCSPLCTSDVNCAVGELHGTCSLRVAGNSLEVWSGPPAGGGVCSMPCETSEECPFGFDCRVQGRCDESLDTGASTCAPCRVDAPEPDGGTVAPATWTCPETWYAGDDGCDCGCGALDPDCSGPTLAACDQCPVDEGACGDCPLVDPTNNAVCVAGPTGWACEPARFGDGTCDCGCGALDDDCTSAEAEVCERCPDSDAGGCNAVGLGCPGHVDPVDNAKCVDTGMWTCSEFYLGDGTCDCGCGSVDTDCSAATSDVCENCPLSGCSLLEFECPGSIDPNDNARCIEGPEGFTCAPALFGDGVCDCGCGAVDSDCASAGIESCAECRGPLAGGCNDDPEEACPGSIDALDNSLCGDAPPAWTCATDYFDQGDGVCDCGCGAFDPDCADALAGSCTVCHDEADGGCNNDGLNCPGSIDPADNAACTG